jgi:hypothetical protein
MSMNHLRVIFILVLCAAFTGDAWAVSGTGYITDTSASRLLSVNLTTGQTQVVGPLAAVANIGGLAYDSQRGVMYGVSPTTSSLYTINLGTGQATLVGPFGIGATMQGAAFDRFTNTIFASDTFNDRLYKINPDTGSAQLVGPTGVEISGLAVDPLTGILYGTPCPFCGGVAGLYRINTLNGQTTLVGGTANIRFNGLAFDGDGTLYGVRNDTDSLHVINKNTGISTLVGPLGLPEINALGFDIVPLPEPSTAALIVAGLIMTGCARTRRFASKRQQAGP